MDSSRPLPPQIEQALARGWIVLTANQRAARTLRHAFDLRQQALGRAIWEPPEILAWETWTNTLWNRLLLDGHTSALLLSRLQEHTLWRDIITADSAAASLRPTDALAETAAAAWKVLHDYRGRSRLHSHPGNSDTRTFARWLAQFERRCAVSQYITQAQLIDALRAAVAAQNLTLCPGYLLIGFDSKSPAQTALLEAVRAAGALLDEGGDTSPPLPSTATPSQRAEEEERPATSAEGSLVSASDETAELAACAHWLRSQLTQNPSASLAVIVPAIDTVRAEIDRVFRPILAPELDDLAAAAGSGPCEFSLGIPLARTPMATTALDVLRWASGPLPLDRISALLLSPHFATDHPDANEHLARAEFDAFVLRRQHLLQPHLSLDDLLRLASRPSHRPHLPALLTHLRALRPLFHQIDSTIRTHADWAAAIHELLEAAAWAPLPCLDSAEFQTRRRWDTALDQLATLDFDSPLESRTGAARIPFSAALAALEHVTAETLFAPESRHAPIQIMGPLESAGSAFDAIWFLRANDRAWPAPSAPNPLLPWQLQRDLAMPGANPAIDSARARHTTQRIAASAPTIFFSYAQESADGRQRPSAILAGLAEPNPSACLTPAEPAPPAITLEAFPDDAPIPSPPDCVHQGGAAILQSQAACGFRAFAEKRLYASALDSLSLGLDPRERGSLVHAVLESFWAETRTQTQLQRMTQDERDAQLARSVDTVLAQHHAHPESGWPRAYLDAERQRLLRLLGRWLHYEATERQPFTVQAREQSLNDVHIGPLRLAVRVDRVDLTEPPEGSAEPAAEIILDYKTGPANPADWLGPRPDAPQLPLYAVVSQTPHLAAVAFASVRPGKYMELNGFQAHDCILPNAATLKTDSLDAQVAEWRDTLTSLAQDFHDGNANVLPKQYPKTCQYCQQRLLCRLDPSALDPDALDDLAADALDSSATEADFG